MNASPKTQKCKWMKETSGTKGTTALKVALVGFISLVALRGLAAESVEPSYKAYAGLLEKYVLNDGVRYAQWHANAGDRQALEDILRQWSTVHPASLDQEKATAFLINLYNAAMIHQVLEHFPIKSVRDIGLMPFAIFRKDIVVLNGSKVSLDAIEKERLLDDYFDPRIHFAVNCASVSCPPLRSEPFTGADLQRQLNEQSILFANSPHAARVIPNTEATAYSELFKWYKDDFPGDDPAEYLNRFRDDPLPVGNTIRWINYDWSLNDADSH